MKLMIFGLAVSSSWGNGHATLWRGLCTALAKRGHEVVFFERDVPYYASTRDLIELPGGGELILYSEWDEAVARARDHVKTADVAMVTSYCPDGIAASDLVLESNAGLRVFYDLDTPVTLWRLDHGQAVDYVGLRGYSDFDLVLSYTGGRALAELRTVLGARRAVPLYGSVDPAVHKPVPPQERYVAALSYMGTWSADRDEALRNLFIGPARRRPESPFVIGWSQYTHDFPWLPNIFFLSHVPPAEHSAFYCSSEITLNATRGPMAAMGYCPSGRLFEAAACGVPILSDSWEGLVAHSTAEAVEAMARPREELARIGRAARQRTLACHTADVRVEEFENIVESARLAVSGASAICGA
jgi:spore maturation protein CgeB